MLEVSRSTLSQASKQASKQGKARQGKARQGKARQRKANIHTHVDNAVTLVWGSLRFTPII